MRMNLRPLFAELVTVFSGERAIEGHVRDALRSAACEVDAPDDAVALPESILGVMAQDGAHPIGDLVARIPFNWAPPQTSDDPLYIKHSISKSHVELLGPNGLVNSDTVRLGLYGMVPRSEYGLRTHPAEEIYVMLAGQMDWKLADRPYVPHLPGERSYHPSLMPHASRTRGDAFISVYAWYGDISTENYVYEGLPDT